MKEESIQGAVTSAVRFDQSRLQIRDSLAITYVSLRTRLLRSALTGAGVAIGIAAMVSVLGVATSSRSDLIAKLDAFGTDLLTARPGQSFVGTETALPSSAPGAIRRIELVEQASALVEVQATARILTARISVGR